MSLFLSSWVSYILVENMLFIFEVYVNICILEYTLLSLLYNERCFKGKNVWDHGDLINQILNEVTNNPLCDLVYMFVDAGKAVVS